jgi:hypothetical protein
MRTNPTGSIADSFPADSTHRANFSSHVSLLNNGMRR